MKRRQIKILSVGFILAVLYFAILLFATSGCTNGKTHRIWVDEETYHRLRSGEKLPPRDGDYLPPAKATGTAPEGESR